MFFLIIIDRYVSFNPKVKNWLSLIAGNNDLKIHNIFSCFSKDISIDMVA